MIIPPLPDRSYAAGPDPEAAGGAVVVRVSCDPAENGVIAGRIAGPRAMACAITAAEILSRTQRQLRPETAARLGYVPDDTCTF